MRYVIEIEADAADASVFFDFISSYLDFLADGLHAEDSFDNVSINGSFYH